MTSGRRTLFGNKLVGGVDGSWHVDGDAVDYDGPDLNKLLREVQAAYPKAKVAIHKTHVHAQQRGLNAPYFGKRGTTGLKGR